MPIVAEVTEVTPVQEPIKELVQATIQEPVQESAQAPVQGSTQEPVQGSTSEPVQGSTTEPVQGSTQEPAASTTEESGNETGGNETGTTTEAVVPSPQIPGTSTEPTSTTAVVLHHSGVWTTSTSEAVAAGSTTIKVLDVTGFTTGMFLTIADGIQSETKEIVSVTLGRRLSDNRRLAAGSVTVHSPISYNFTAGAIVKATFQLSLPEPGVASAVAPAPLAETPSTGTEDTSCGQLGALTLFVVLALMAMTYAILAISMVGSYKTETWRGRSFFIEKSKTERAASAIQKKLPWSVRSREFLTQGIIRTVVEHITRESLQNWFGYQARLSVEELQVALACSEECSLPQDAAYRVAKLRSNRMAISEEFTKCSFSHRVGVMFIMLNSYARNIWLINLSVPSTLQILILIGNWPSTLMFFAVYLLASGAVARCSDESVQFDVGNLLGYTMWGLLAVVTTKVILYGFSRASKWASFGKDDGSEEYQQRWVRRRKLMDLVVAFVMNVYIVLCIVLVISLMASFSSYSSGKYWLFVVFWIATHFCGLPLFMACVYAAMAPCVISKDSRFMDNAVANLGLEKKVSVAWSMPEDDSTTLKKFVQDSSAARAVRVAAEEDVVHLGGAADSHLRGTGASADKPNVQGLSPSTDTDDDGNCRQAEKAFAWEMPQPPSPPSPSRGQQHLPNSPAVSSSEAKSNEKQQQRKELPEDGGSSASSSTVFSKVAAVLSKKKIDDTPPRVPQTRVVHVSPKAGNGSLMDETQHVIDCDRPQSPTDAGSTCSSSIRYGDNTGTITSPYTSASQTPSLASASRPPSQASAPRTPSQQAFPPRPRSQGSDWNVHFV